MSAEKSHEKKELPTEIERKYLLSSVPPEILGVAPQMILQGYIPGTRIHERLRRVEDERGLSLVRTIKLGKGVERIEVEEDVDDALFARLWPLTEGARVMKRRYRMPHEGLVWEIDVFDDRELVLAEIELPSVDHEFVFPDWLSRFVVREVTDEAAYLNLRLAR